MNAREVNMRSFITRVVLATLLFTVQGPTQVANKPPGKKEDRKMPHDIVFPYNYATMRLPSKGGVGIINSDLFIVTNSAKNELILRDGKEWTGQAGEKREFVIVFQDRVLSAAKLPNDFDLSKAVIVSFEGDVIRYFTFREMEGGYYERTKPDR